MIFMGELAWFHGFPQYWPDFTGLTVGLTPVSSFDPGLWGHFSVRWSARVWGANAIQLRAGVPISNPLRAWAESCGLRLIAVRFCIATEGAVQCDRPVCGAWVAQPTCSEPLWQR